MFGRQPINSPQRIAFLLIPRFSMMAFTSSVEPLRSANRMSGETLYQWRTFSLDGNPVIASNEVVVEPQGALDDEIDCDVLFVCAGIQARQFHDARAFARLRSLVRSGIAIGGVCSGSMALAAAGLLAGYRCTIHWEYVESFVESYPELDVTATLFEVDRNRYTCSGGTAPLDMMINSIAGDHGEDLAIAVAEQMLHTFVRHPHDSQRIPVKDRIGISHPKLLAAIAHMEAFLESPVSVPELAEAVALSERQLERLFREQLQTTPTQYYLRLRLQRARLLLRHTEMPILQIAVASGFHSASHFARAYRRHYRHSPREERTHIERIPGLSREVSASPIREPRTR